jgi:hypothetical protein
LITGSVGQDVRGIYLLSRALASPEKHERARAQEQGDGDDNNESSHVHKSMD